MSVSPAEIGKRVAVFVVVVGLIVAGAAGAATVLVPTPGVENVTVPQYSAFDAEKTAPDRVEEAGEITLPDGIDAGTVVVDDAHANRVERGDVTALERAIAQAGGQVRYLRPFRERAGNPGIQEPNVFNETLADADAFVILDPGVRYTDDELTALEEFVDSGGRLLLGGEPNYNEIQGSGLQVRLATQRNQLAEVGSQFGLAFGTEYLINMRPEGNDAIYKNIEATGGNSELSAGVDTAVFYTATAVYPTGEGTELLVGENGTRLARASGGSHPVMSLNSEGTVLGVGDTTFMEESKHTVADNEVVLVRLAEFLAEGDADYEPPERNGTTDSDPS